MIKQFTLLFLFSLTCSLSISQEKITEIIKEENPHRIIVKKIGTTNLLLKISPDDYLRVYEIQGEELVIQDERYYPDLFVKVNYEVSNNFFLTSNENGSIAYDLRDFSEFIIPYEDGDYLTQWDAEHNDFVRLLQTSFTYKQMYIDLINKDIIPTPRNETILDLTDNYRRLRREFEDNEDELHVITNLNNQDSIVVSAGQIAGRRSNFNDNYFIYNDQDLVIKIDNSDFYSSTLMEIPEGQTFRSVYLVDKYSIVTTRNASLKFEIRIFDENDLESINIESDYEFGRIHNAVINNHIIFSGNINQYSTLDLSTGLINEQNFNYNYTLFDLDDEYLITYANEQLKFISKADLSISSRTFNQLKGSISNITLIDINGIHYVSFDTRNEGDNPLVKIIGTDVEASTLLDDEVSGISSSPNLWQANNSKKLVLIEDDLYSFDKNGYNQINENIISQIYLNTSIKTDENQICWSENNTDLQFQIKCFKNNTLIDYGSLPNINVSFFTTKLNNFIVNGNSILYYHNEASSNRELRIKSNDTGIDSLLTTLNSSRDFIEVDNKAFFEIEDTLYTFDFIGNRLHNLEIPIHSQFSFLDVIAHNGSVFVKNRDFVYKVNGLENTVIYASTSNEFLGRMSSFGEYLNISTSSGYTFYNDESIQSIALENTQQVKFLGGEYISIIDNNSINEPTQIYNLATQETFNLPDEFNDRIIEYVLENNGSPIVISQNRINSLNSYSIDRFDSEFITYTIQTSIPKITRFTGGSKLIESEEHTLVILDETVLYFDNLTGEITDMVTVLGFTAHLETIYKDNILYFIKHDKDIGRQVFMYDYTISSNIKLPIAEFKLYPIPTENILTIKSLESIQKWSLSTASGQELMSAEPSNTQIDINVNHLPTGIYFIHIISGGKKGIQKFIKI